MIYEAEPTPPSRVTLVEAKIAPNEVVMEHRWGHRREVSRPVRLETSSGVIARGRITNCSISGAFVVSPLPVVLFSHVEVRFMAMIDGERTTTAVLGQVVRRDTVGFAIEWSEFAPDAVRALVMVPPFRATQPARPVWEASAPVKNNSTQGTRIDPGYRRRPTTHNT
jgi:hypothetical protein